MAFRREVAQAAARKDRGKLAGFYAERFSHSDASVRSQDRAARLALLMAGAPLIETAPVEALQIAVHAGGWSAVVTGVATLRGGDGASEKERFTQMLARRGDDAWQIAASHAGPEREAAQ